MEALTIVAIDTEKLVFRADDDDDDDEEDDDDELRWTSGDVVLYAAS